MEELDATKATLEGIERQLYVDGYNLDEIEESISTAWQLLRDVDPLPSLSAVVSVREKDCVHAVNLMSHVQGAVDADHSAVWHTKLLHRGESYPVIIDCRDCFREKVNGVRSEDVVVGLSNGASGWVILDKTLTVKDETVSVRVSPTAKASRAASLCIRIGSTRFEVPLEVCVRRHIYVFRCLHFPNVFAVYAQAASSIFGKHVRTLELHGSRKSYSGLAVSPDGSVIVLTNVVSHRIAVYGSSDGALRAEFGGYGREPGTFDRPRNVCFVPSRGSNILVADEFNERVQVH